MHKEPAVVNCRNIHLQLTTDVILIQIQTELTLPLSLIHYQISLKISTKTTQSLTFSKFIKIYSTKSQVSYHSSIFFFTILVLD